MLIHLRRARALKSHKRLWLIRLIGWIKNYNDQDYDGDDKRSVTNGNPALERTDNEEVHAQKKTQATRKSIGHLCSTKLTWLAVK